MLTLRVQASGTAVATADIVAIEEIARKRHTATCLDALARDMSAGHRSPSRRPGAKSDLRWLGGAPVRHRGATAAGAVIAVLAEWATATDHGLFAAISHTHDRAIWFLQLYLAVVFLGGLMRPRPRPR